MTVSLEFKSHGIHVSAMSVMLNVHTISNNLHKCSHQLIGNQIQWIKCLIKNKQD